jgi:hypothetical protein
VAVVTVSGGIALPLPNYLTGIAQMGVFVELVATPMADPFVHR